MKTFAEIAKKLLTIKSIVTLVLTVVFAYLSAIGKISSAEFITIFASVIGFYFGTQSEKKKRGVKRNV